MTKDDLMANWDRVVTDRRLTLELVEGHLAGVESDTYLFDELHAVASGGSTGRRGIFVFGWRAWAKAYAGFMRPSLWDRAVAPELAAQPMRVAMVGARIATHMTSAMPQTFANPMVDVALFPVTQPIDRIVAGLNAYQPLALMGYPSMLALLAAEARAGRLRILPRRVTTTSEPLLPEVRRALTEAFCAPVANMYGTSEAGPIGVGCFRRPGIHLCDDLVIVEPVDLDGRPVPPGVRSDKLYVTALVNPTLPLIRFELTDQVTFLDGPCPCGSAHQLIADVESRLDDVFTYPGGLVVHPHVFGAQLRRDRGIVEYQVRQTPAGAEVLVVGARPTRPPPAGPWPPSWPAWACPTRRSRSTGSTGWNASPPARSAASARSPGPWRWHTRAVPDGAQPVPRQLFLQLRRDGDRLSVVRHLNHQDLSRVLSQS
jgi:phenylacetate-CoA ligase